MEVIMLLTESFALQAIPVLANGEYTVTISDTRVEDLLYSSCITYEFTGEYTVTFTIR
jgi:hypothetical protein